MQHLENCKYSVNINYYYVIGPSFDSSALRKALAQAYSLEDLQKSTCPWSPYRGRGPGMKMTLGKLGDEEPGPRRGAAGL